MLGIIIGSFLNVVIYRLHTGKSLNGRSHCMSCGKTLSWFELFPIFSYFFLRGKCRGCRAYIPSRYFLVEFFTGILYMLVWHLFGGSLLLTILNLILISLLMIIVVYDMRHTIIPDELSLGVGVVAIALLIQDFILYRNITDIGMSVIGGLCVFIFFGGLWYISKGRWIGFGDAKLALPLAIIVGLGGVFSMVVLSFWIGALVSVMLLGVGKIVNSGKIRLQFRTLPLTIKSEIPFAPFLIMGFLLVHFFHADIFSITYALFFA